MGTIAPPLKWHGGKHYLAPKIVALMPLHTHYVEPYFGGGSVLLAKDPNGVSEVVNDLDTRLTNFWRWLQDEGTFGQFRDRLQAIPFSEVEFDAACARSDARPLSMMDSLDAAVDFFVQCRQSLAGRTKAFATLSRNRTRRGMNEQASAWLSAIEGLPAVHARLQRVVILNRDAVDVIRQQDGPKTLFYCDPPYLHETRATTGQYAHEMAHDQHVGLLDALTEIAGKFMLSGYRSELYDGYAKHYGLVRHDFDLPNNSAGGKTKRRMTECVWCNF